MQILVTGASGAIGGNLVPALIREGYSVLAQSRREQPPSTLRGLSWCQSSLDDVAQLRSLLSQCQAVIHLASSRRASGRRKFSDIEQQSRCLCEAAQGLPLEHIVVAGSAGVYGDRQGLISEDTPPGPDNGYRLAKWRSEWIFRQSGLPISIIRLPIVLGPGVKDWHKTQQVFRSPGFRHIGNGQNRFHPIHMEDAVESLLSALRAGPQSKLPYLVAAAEPVTSREAAVLLGARSNGRLPGFPFNLLFGFSSRLFRVTGLEWRFPHRYEFFFRDNFYSFDRTRRMLGFEPRYSVAQAIADLP